MPVQLTILGSGSSGNCAYLETGQARLLIDAGLSARQIRRRMATFGRAPETLTGILITHEHSDHTMGLGGLAALDVPVYCNRLTKEAIQAQFDREAQMENQAGLGNETVEKQPQLEKKRKKINAQLFSTGGSFEIGDVTVDAFSVPHDALDPVGFLVRTTAGHIGFLTDLGHATKMVIERIRTANVLLLEANHDVKMLQDDVRRPWSLKQRILSRHGHLSNDGAADVAEQILSPTLRRLYLGHLSRDCNRPALALRAVAGRLEGLGAAHVWVEPASQHIPSATFSL